MGAALSKGPLEVCWGSWVCIDLQSRALLHITALLQHILAVANIVDTAGVKFKCWASCAALNHPNEALKLTGAKCHPRQRLKARPAPKPKAKPAPNLAPSPGQLTRATRAHISGLWLIVHCPPAGLPARPHLRSPPKLGFTPARLCAPGSTSSRAHRPRTPAGRGRCWGRRADTPRPEQTGPRPRS